MPASLTQIRHTLLKPVMGQHLLHLRPRRRRAALALPQRAQRCSSARCQQRTRESGLAEDLGWASTWCVSAAAAAARWRCSSASSSAWMLLSAARSCATTAAASPPRPPARHPSINQRVSHNIVQHRLLEAIPSKTLAQVTLLSIIYHPVWVIARRCALLRDLRRCLAAQPACQQMHSMLPLILMRGKWFSVILMAEVD